MSYSYDRTAAGAVALLGWRVQDFLPSILKRLGSGLDPKTFEFKVVRGRLKFRVKDKRQTEGVWSGAWGIIDGAKWDSSGTLQLMGDWSSGELGDQPKL